jgi:hypothetical protein
VTNDFTSNDNSKHSVNPQDNWLEIFKANVDTSFFNNADTNISYADVSKRWALWWQHLRAGQITVFKQTSLPFTKNSKKWVTMTITLS